MADKPTTPGQSSNEPSSREIAAAGRDVAEVLNEMFNDPESGAYCVGVVVAVNEPEKREGRNSKGNPYSFIGRRIQLQTKDGPVICAETQETMGAFLPIQIYKRVKWAIKRCRMDGSQMVFDVNPYASA